MVLSDRDIEKALADGRIIVTPSLDTSTQLGSCSIDFRLGYSFRVFAHTRHPFIDPQDSRLMADIMEEITVPEGEAFIMRPGEFVLATTIEHLTLPDDLLGRIEGRSSLGRIGIIVHSTASIFDPGWVGIPVLELGNLGMMPVALRPGMRICSFTFEELSSPVNVPYTKKKSAKYVNQAGPDASRYAREFIRHTKK
jgi:dCTP deaminase